MSSKAAANVREKFLLEFVTADSEVAALKSLFKKADALPQLVLFDSEEINAENMSHAVVESAIASKSVDEVEDLCALFSSVA
jgi:hypothetical protein